MKVLLLLSSVLFFAYSVNAQANNGLNPGASLLFQNIKTKTTTTEKNSIYTKLGFLLSADKKQFIADKEAADYPFDAWVYPTDLNKDGKEEIFVLFGNSYTSGSAGSSIMLFIKNSTELYTPHLGFPGTLPDALVTTANVYPDLLIGGPDFEYPVWRWNGKSYVFNRKVKDQDYEKMKKENIEDLSKKYTASF